MPHYDYITAGGGELTIENPDFDMEIVTRRFCCGTFRDDLAIPELSS